MKHVTVRTFLLGTALLAGSYISSCKDKAKNTDSDSTTTTIAPAQIDTTPTPPAITVAPNNTLSDGARDATKDYPGVTAAVENGEITLTGDITRDKLPKLMMSLSSLHAKKITNNLKVK